MTAQPTVTQNQYVTQNGWTVTPSDVEPVWVVDTISQAQQSWNSAVALNMVTLGTNAINNWSAGPPYSAAKDTVLLDLLKVVVAMLQAKFDVSN